jgi:hypothetical protein
VLLTWFGWTFGYALAVWGLDVFQSLLEPRRNDERQANVARWGRFLVALGLAFAIGFWVRSWWWIAGPFVATVLPVLIYPVFDYLKNPRPLRQQAGTGLILAIFTTLVGGGVAALAACAGVVCGRWWEGR